MRRTVLIVDVVCESSTTRMSSSDARFLASILISAEGRNVVPYGEPLVCPFPVQVTVARGHVEVHGEAPAP